MKELNKLNKKGGNQRRIMTRGRKCQGENVSPKKYNGKLDFIQRVTMFCKEKFKKVQFQDHIMEALKLFQKCIWYNNFKHFSRK